VTSQNEDFRYADLEHGAYLTVNWAVEAEKNKVNDDSREGSHACQGVDLPNTIISSPTAQKPGVLERRLSLLTQIVQR